MMNHHDMLKTKACDAQRPPNATIHPVYHDTITKSKSWVYVMDDEEAKTYQQ
jgi:hypothetical protein